MPNWLGNWRRQTNQQAMNEEDHRAQKRTEDECYDHVGENARGAESKRIRSSELSQDKEMEDPLPTEQG